ncbi:DUF4397 domain-containing protein [Chromatiaceae bacterium AAb-1]|nr:DUF4397 domain-containing protein [Chromatiaceae bacterium AAb-1]
MKRFFSAHLLAAVTLAGLAGCGGSSGGDDSEFNQSYIQFYNGSASNSSVAGAAGETSLGTATYGDASSLVTVEPGSYTLKLTNSNTTDTLLEQELSLAKGDKTLFLLTESSDQPDYLQVSFSRNDALDNAFNLHLANLSAQYPQLDIYLGEEGKPFADAELVTGLSLNEITATASNHATGKYNLYLTEAGQQTPVFERRAVDFRFTTTYVLIVRDKHGPIEQQIVVDIVLNSTTVENLDHENATAQYRIYNGLAATDISVALDNTEVLQLAEGDFSAYQSVNRGDYSLSVRDADTTNQILLNSALLSITPGQSRALLVFEDVNQQVSLLNIAETELPQVQSHDVAVANLVPEEGTLSVYFVRQNETINTARYHVKNLDPGKQAGITLPKDYYAIALVKGADSSSANLLYKTDLMQLESGKRYVIAAESDPQSASGYHLTLLY